MTAEQSPWQRIIDLRNPPKDIFDPHPGIPEYKGWFKMFRIEWGTVGTDENDTRYEMSVVEHEPSTSSSTLTFARHLMGVNLSFALKEREDMASLSGNYFARFRAGKLLGVSGHLEFEGQNDALMSGHALGSFRSALEIAEFEPVELESVRPFPQMKK